MALQGLSNGALRDMHEARTEMFGEK